RKSFRNFGSYSSSSVYIVCVFIHYLARSDFARKCPCEIHLGVDRRRRHTSFAKHQQTSPKQTEDTDNADRYRDPSIGREKCRDRDRHTRQDKETQAVIKCAHRPLKKPCTARHLIK